MKQSKTNKPKKTNNRLFIITIVAIVFAVAAAGVITWNAVSVLLLIQTIPSVNALEVGAVVGLFMLLYYTVIKVSLQTVKQEKK
ncbi:MAG: hypothetical protein LBO69_09700 [Ignavibacteria bacterium]|jgi:ACR3 family arsenite efflux pump ArsB|nr:hypothetical protein [Ignavibacteria bacterium]